MSVPSFSPSKFSEEPQSRVTAFVEQLDKDRTKPSAAVGHSRRPGVRPGQTITTHDVSLQARLSPTLSIPAPSSPPVHPLDLKMQIFEHESTLALFEPLIQHLKRRCKVAKRELKQLKELEAAMEAASKKRKVSSGKGKET